MAKDLHCKKCEVYLGEMEKGKIRNGSVLLCAVCWKRAELAIEIADLAKKQSKDILGGSGSKQVDDLLGIFGMKK
jgi:hypothetical protein